MSVLSFKTQAALDRAVEALKAPLKDNLYSCVLYGSAVRGEYVLRRTVDRHLSHEVTGRAGLALGCRVGHVSRKRGG